MTDNYRSRVAASDRFLPQWENELARHTATSGNSKPSVIRALFRAFGGRLILSGFLKAINDACLFISPMLLKNVIRFIQNRTPGKVNNNTTGILLAFGLFGTYLTQTLVFNQYFNFNATVESLVRSSLISSVYRKSCRLSPSSRANYTSGQIQNLMSNDSRTVAEVVLYFHMLWSSMEQVILAMVLLIQLLGPIPAFSGVAVLLIFIPLQSFLIGRIRIIREIASSCTDERVKVVSEVIKGIKLVKLYAWELSFVKRILRLRAKELLQLRKMIIFGAWSGICYNSIPTILTLVVFCVYVALGNTLDAAIVFPAISLFNVLRPAMIIFPYVLVSCARAAASLSRLQGFFMADELVSLEDSEHAVDQRLLRDRGLDVLAVDAAFSWNPETDDRPTLSGLSVELPRGSLVAVVGNTGSGKSTLLSGLLGETPIVSGQAGLLSGRSVAFCDQLPFIQNATVRENILFGKPFDETHYLHTLRACSLETDLAILPAGDQTELGSKGVNLSGGQRARVSLARAVYSKADICLLDDPLSAVDAHVAKSIFNQCVVGLLQEKTRVLATNQIHFAMSTHVDVVVVVKDGVVVEAGDRRMLMSDPNSAFSELLALSGDLGKHGSEDSDDSDDNNNDSRHDNHNNDNEDDDDDVVKDMPVDEGDKIGVVATSGRVTSLDPNTSSPAMAGLRKRIGKAMDYGTVEAGKLIKAEEKEKGRVQVKHYVTYLRAMGLQWVIPVFILALVFNALQLCLNVWISYWSDLDEAGGGSSGSSTSSTMFNLMVFFSLGVASVVATSGVQFNVAYGSIRASIILHEKLLMSVLGAPSSFFNTNPDGRIVNRFTADMDKLDQQLSSTLQALNRLVVSLIFTIALIVFVMPPFIFVVIPIVTFCVYIQEFYRRTSVDLRRLEALARSPLYSHFSETLDGVVTIRAYGDVPRAMHINNMHTDLLSRTMYASAYVNRWLSLRLEGLGTCLILTATLAAVLYPPGRISSGIAGLVLSYTMQILGVMTWTVRQFTETESQMSAMERVAEYSNPPFPQEEHGGLEHLLQSMHHQHTASMTRSQSHGLISDSKISQLNVSSSLGHQRPRWPKKGVIKFDHVEMRYRSDLPPALRDLTLTVRSGEHVGIVGRTGAGKSSAIQCLFRLYELSNGRILIDGNDISKMRLYDLRSALGVIPQEPICFSGTIRSNLDMFGEHDDDDVLRALDACGLQATMRDEVGLDTEVQEGGSNFSVGQRQLLCLGRALLKDSQVVVLDEATSNVSNEVDEKIQQTLRDEMAHCTILTVAHRLHTVIGSDRIVVMDKGRIAEIGRPNELLSGPSMLSDLVDETGPATAAYLRQLAFTAAAGEKNKSKYHTFAHNSIATSSSNATTNNDSGQSVVANGGTTDNDEDDGRSLKLTMSDDSNVNEADMSGVLMNGGVDTDPSVRSMMREAFTELRSALSKLDRIDVVEALSDAGESKDSKSFKAMASTLINRLAVIGTDVSASSDVQLPLDAAAHSSGAVEDMAAELSRNGSGNGNHVTDNMADEEEEQQGTSNGHRSESEE